MNIKIEITEEEIRDFIEDAIELAIKRNIERLFKEEYGMGGYRELMSRVTEKAIAEMPQYFKNEKDRSWTERRKNLREGSE